MANIGGVGKICDEAGHNFLCGFPVYVLLAFFGHVARMPPGVPAHDALFTALGVLRDSASDPSWKRPRGRPRTSWTEQLRRDMDGTGLWEAWYLAMDRERWREFATSLCCSDVIREIDRL